MVTTRLREGAWSRRQKDKKSGELCSSCPGQGQRGKEQSRTLHCSGGAAPPGSPPQHLSRGHHVPGADITQVKQRGPLSTVHHWLIGAVGAGARGTPLQCGWGLRASWEGFRQLQRRARL